jgi:hypothetical protein
MPKASKSEVDYSLGHKDAHCGKSFEDGQGLLPVFHPAVVEFSARTRQRPDQPRVLVPAVCESAQPVTLINHRQKITSSTALFPA